MKTDFDESVVGKVAKRLGLTFKTVSKAATCEGGRWRDCEARGVRVRDELKREDRGANPS